MTNPDTTDTTRLTDEQILTLVNGYHEKNRAAGTLELVASEIAGHGLPEIVQEVTELAEELHLHLHLEPADYRKLTTAVRNYGTKLAAELETAKIEVGAKVRIKVPQETKLGAMPDVDGRFVGFVRGMTDGTFRGIYPDERLSGWALVDVPVDVVELGDGWTLETLGNPETFVVPVHASNVERVG